MNPQLTWHASLPASRLHAAWAAAAGRAIVDPTLRERVAQPGLALAREMAACGWPAEAAWTHLVALSPGVPNPRELAELVWRKLRGGSCPNEAAVAISGHLRAILSAGDDEAQSARQLELRTRPLREQWEARGPGLMRALADFTEPDLLVERADVLVVSPATGGDGRAHALYNSVRIEGLLANADPRLPEVVRLGWLLAQLNLELPIFSEQVDQRRLPRLGELATLPAILRAAEEVELARLDAATVQLALDSWHITAPPLAELPALLLSWWSTYQAGRPRWAIALRALDQMLTGG
ncbi:MAG: hypothetical protein KDA62_03950 [Planctomycetales bacterium]|nr:hypothetical protein [Planctomycetales bacterium]